MTMKLLPVFVVSVMLAIPCAASAYVPVPQAMACMLYFKSDVVFTGQVLAKEPMKGGAGWVYTLKVMKSYRGAGAPTLKVFTADDSGRLPLDEGKQYLLFAFNQDGRLSIAYDQVSGELKDTQQALKDLDKVMARRPGDGGDIYGRVTKRVFGPDTGGLGGIPVTLQGPDGNTRVVTDQNGWFKVHVPTGTYSATALSPDWKFQPEGMAWEDASAFQVPDGGCAEIQIQALPNSNE
jgi:hypothetical protein